MFTHTLVIIGSPHQNTVTPEIIKKALDQLPNSAQVKELAGHDASEISFELIESEAKSANWLNDLRKQLEQIFVNIPVDLCLVENDPPRKKKLLISDMDSTIIQQECIDEIAKMAGVGPQVSQVTERAMRGEIEFETALLDRVEALKGLTIDDLKSVLDSRITLMPGARKLVQTMRSNGAYCALVSGGFTYFTSQIAERVGFNSDQANELELKDNRLTGKVRDPILGRQAKFQALRTLISKINIDRSATMAVGDGANDLQMMQHAGFGVAFHAKPVVAAQARFNITYGDLTALLYLQGYRRKEFVT